MIVMTVILRSNFASAADTEPKFIGNMGLQEIERNWYIAGLYLSPVQEITVYGRFFTYSSDNYAPNSRSLNPNKKIYLGVSFQGNDGNYAVFDTGLAGYGIQTDEFNMGGCKFFWIPHEGGINMLLSELDQTPQSMRFKLYMLTKLDYRASEEIKKTVCTGGVVTAQRPKINSLLPDAKPFLDVPVQ